MERYANFRRNIDEREALIEKLRPIAEELDCSLAQLVIAWAASNDNVSTVLLGASGLKQLEVNVQAYAVIEKLTPEIKTCIEEVMPCKYNSPVHGFFYSMRQKYL